MPAISYTIAGLTFDTQKDLAAYVSALLRRYWGPVQLQDDEATFMSELLLRHPSAEEKIGCGLKAIWIKRNGTFGNGFYVERTDGTFIDFSYKQCIRPFTHASKAKFAFRRAIVDQVIEVKSAAFGDADTILCMETGEPITWQMAHVDHEPPLTFAALLIEYTSLRAIDLNTIELYEPKGGIGSLLPPEIEADWAEWHRQRAKLRVISAEANMRLAR